MILSVREKYLLEQIANGENTVNKLLQDPAILRFFNDNKWTLTNRLDNLRSRGLIIKTWPNRFHISSTGQRVLIRERAD